MQPNYRGRSPRRVPAAFIPLAAISPGAAADPSDVQGQWASDGSVIEIYALDGRLSAVIVALMDPMYGEDEDQGPAGTPRLDHRNPDPDKRNQPIVGLNLLSGYRFQSGKWQGKIYDPESGNLYSSNMRVEDGRLQMRGYIGLPMFGRTAAFVPVTCTSQIQAMFDAVARPLAC